MRRQQAFLPCALFFIFSAVLLFALRPSPPQERWSADTRFRVHEHVRGSKRPLKLRLDVRPGVTYGLEEKTTQLTRISIPGVGTIDQSEGGVSKQQVEIGLFFRLERRFPNTDLGLEFTISRFNLFESQRGSPTDLMWKELSHTLVGQRFSGRVASDGTVVSLGTADIRRKIVDKLHALGRVPIRLEHALVVLSGFGETRTVYNCTGAEFNMRGERLSKAPITGPLVALNSAGCSSFKLPPRPDGGSDVAHAAPVLLIPRGECAFVDKARYASEVGAAAVVIYNTDEREGDDTVVVMKGDETGTVSIPSLFVSAKTGRALRATIDAAERFAGDVRSAGSAVLAEVLSGAAAVEAIYGGVGGEAPRGGDDWHSSSESFVDLLGLDYTIEDQIRKRFAIFPEQSVGVGDSWKRVTKRPLPGLPGRFTRIEESYRIKSLQRASAGPMFGVGARGDSFLTLEVHTFEEPHPDNENAVPAGDLAPMLSSPAAAGMKFVEQGWYTLHAPSGMVVDGATSARIGGSRDILLQTTEGQQMVVNADFDVNARTRYYGTISAAV